MDQVFEGEAPGRLDVMGGIADYSGSLVLQLALPKNTRVRIELRNDYQCLLESNLTSGERLHASVDYRKLLDQGKVSYSFAQNQFKQFGKDGWVAYVLGCAMVLQLEKGVDFRGAQFIIHSDVPLGKGVSSSASLEVATMKALGLAFHVEFHGTELAMLAQRVENQVVGAPCGLMDQLSGCFGEQGKLLPIHCQPDTVLEPVEIPEDVFFAGIDSGVKHSVGSSAYADARCAAFMGYSIIAESLGLTKTEISNFRKTRNRQELPYEGYLCNISIDEFESRFRKLLPDVIIGKDFMNRFGFTIDPETEINPDTEYKIIQCTAHPVYENHRVNRFREKLDMLKRVTLQNDRNKILHDMGTCMYQSHESYSRCGLGDAKTDEIVRFISGEPGIYGARITGAGQGGTVCVFGAGEDGRQSVLNVCKQTGTQLI
jgi:L-arabinokinase